MNEARRAGTRRRKAACVAGIVAIIATWVLVESTHCEAPLMFDWSAGSFEGPSGCTTVLVRGQR